MTLLIRAPWGWQGRCPLTFGGSQRVSGVGVVDFSGGDFYGSHPAAAGRRACAIVGARLSSSEAPTLL
eukprot:6207230-Pleurochrysis_carterae.AAC.1